MAWIRITHASGEAHTTICQILASVGCEAMMMSFFMMVFLMKTVLEMMLHEEIQE